MPEPSLSIVDIAFRKQGKLVPHDELCLTYAVDNPPDGEACYLLNLQADLYKQLNPRPRATLSAELAPTCYLAIDGVLIFYAGMIERDADPKKTYLAPFVPGATRLDPKARFEATIRAPLPLAEWSPYTGPVRSGANVKPMEVNKLRLALDYVLDKEAGHKGPHPEQPGAFDVSPHPLKQLRADATPPKPIPMLLRTDKFIRFGPYDNVPPPAEPEAPKPRPPGLPPWVPWP